MGNSDGKSDVCVGRSGTTVLDCGLFGRGRFIVRSLSAEVRGRKPRVAKLLLDVLGACFGCRSAAPEASAIQGYQCGLDALLGEHGVDDLDDGFLVVGAECFDVLEKDRKSKAPVRPV